MHENNLFVSAADSVAFGSSDNNSSQFGDNKIQVLIQTPVFSFKPSGSVKVKQLRSGNVRLDEFKCYKCYGQGQDVTSSCRVCDGTEFISNDHPIITAMGDIIKRKGSNWSSVEEKASLSNNLLGAQLQIKEVINEESFSTPQEWTQTCSVCKIVFELTEKQKQRRSKVMKCPNCLIKESRSSNAANWLTVGNGLKRTARLRKISEQIDSEDGIIFVLRDSRKADDSLFGIEGSSKQQFSGQDVITRKKMVQNSIEGLQIPESQEQNILLDSLVLLDKAQHQNVSKLEALQSQKDVFSFNQSSIENPSLDMIQNAQFKLDYSEIKPKIEQSSSLKQKRAHEMSQVHKFRSQESLGKVNLSLQYGRFNSVLNRQRKPQKGNNLQGSSIWDNLNYSKISKPYQFKDYACDSCQMQPILNKRFHCTNCEDFDLCQKCFRQTKDQHQHSEWQEIDGIDIMAEREKFVQEERQKKQSQLKGSSFSMLNSNLKNSHF